MPSVLDLSPQQAHQRLVAILKEKSYQKRKVVLSSGRISDFYVDGKQTTLHAEGAALIGRLVVDKIRAVGDIVAVGGLTLGADPIATAASVLSTMDGGPPIHAFIVRKESKGHGTGAYIEGRDNLPQGAKVTIVEDTSTTGASAYRAVERARAAGYEVAQVITIVDRQEGAAQYFADRDLTLESLVMRQELEN